MTTDDIGWRDRLPRKRMGAGALIRDDAGRVLIVKPTYKPTWELPGGRSRPTNRRAEHARAKSSWS